MWGSPFGYKKGWYPKEKNLCYDESRKTVQ